MSYELNVVQTQKTEHIEQRSGIFFWPPQLNCFGRRCLAKCGFRDSCCCLVGGRRRSGEWSASSLVVLKQQQQQHFPKGKFAYDHFAPADLTPLWGEGTKWRYCWRYEIGGSSDGQADTAFGGGSMGGHDEAKKVSLDEIFRGRKGGGRIVAHVDMTGTLLSPFRGLFSRFVIKTLPVKLLFPAATAVYFSNFRLPSFFQLLPTLLLFLSPFSTFLSSKVVQVKWIALKPLLFSSSSLSCDGRKTIACQGLEYGLLVETGAKAQLQFNQNLFKAV